LHNLESLENLNKLNLLFLGFNPIVGEEEQFKKDIMGVENIKTFIESYKKWKQLNGK